jgi:hypothetical protein
VKCTNPECFFDSPYLRDGSLHLLELELHSDRRIESNERGFPMRSSPRRFFWLCVKCAKRFTIAKWTPSGVVLALRKLVTLTSDMDAPENADSPLTGGDPDRALFQAARWKLLPQQEG